jgi:hypothetical protein
METLIHADIFFFVTTLLVIVITIVLAFAGFYVVRILKDMKAISGKVQEESEKIAADIEGLRSKIKEEGSNWRGLGKFFGFFKNKNK